MGVVPCAWGRQALQPTSLLREEGVFHLNAGTWDWGAGTVAKDLPTGGSAAGMPVRSAWLCAVVFEGTTRPLGPLWEGQHNSGDLDCGHPAPRASGPCLCGWCSLWGRGGKVGLLLGSFECGARPLDGCPEVPQYQGV